MNKKGDRRIFILKNTLQIELVRNSVLPTNYLLILGKFLIENLFKSNIIPFVRFENFSIGLIRKSFSIRSWQH